MKSRRILPALLSAVIGVSVLASGCGVLSPEDNTAFPDAASIEAHISQPGKDAPSPHEGNRPSPKDCGLSLFDPSADIIILHTNDTHGYVKADDTNEIIGFDSIASIRKSAGENALLFDAGDMSNGLPFAAKSRGIAPVRVMNRVRYDAATIGNHEFDVPDDNILKIINEARFPLLSANIRNQSDGSLFTHPNQIFTVAGIRVGVFGLTTTEAAVNPITSKVLDFGTPESIISDAVSQADKLRKAGCEIVILLSHLGISPGHSSVTSIDVAEALGNKLDVIIDGHTHTPPSHNNVVNGVPVVSAGGEAASNVGWVTFSKTPDEGYAVKYGYIDFQTARDHFLPDPEITALIDELNRPVEEMAENVMTVIDADLDGEKSDIRTRETNLGNTLADAAAAFTGADAAIMNSGGIRASLKKGEVTELEAYTVLPFGDSIYMSEVKGSVILEALERACSNYPEPEGTFAQVSGISYTFNPEKPAGSRVVSVEIGGRALIGDAVYKLATNDFWAIGGNGYDMFIEPFKSPCDYEKSQGSIYVMDVFIWYLNQNGGVTSKVEGRINTVSQDTLASGRTPERNAA